MGGGANRTGAHRFAPAGCVMEEPDEIQRELNRLWDRVTANPPESFIPATSAPPLSSDIPSIAREASMTAIQLIKRQYRQEAARLRQLIELKERAARVLQDRLSAAESEVASLRRRSLQGEESVFREVADVQAELQQAHESVKAQEQRFREEEGLLRRIAEETRKQLAAETSRWRALEHHWNEREQQYLLDIRELQARAQKAFESAAKNEGRHRKSLSELQEAKTAIESTLAELLKERQDREGSNKERDKARERVKEIEEHVQQLQNLWNEERAQWQELWDRERSTWETQRQEFASWEDKVRTDRRDWHGQLKGLEGRETKYREQMAEITRKSAQAGEKVTELLHKLSGRMAEIANLKAVKLVPPAPRRPFDWRPVKWGAALALALAVAIPVWKHLHRLRFELVASHVLTAETPTGIAYDGNALWLGEWEGRLSSLDPDDPSTVLSSVRVKKSGIYHPVSLAVWSDALYTLDSAQGRIMRHPVADPSKISLRWESPGPAPVALAHDGQNLWSYDAASRAVYRHLGEGRDAQVDAYKIELDVLVSAMAWHRDRLWVYDAKNGQILVFQVVGKSLKLVNRAPFETPLQGLVLTYRAGLAGTQHLELWGLSVPEAGVELPTLKKYRVTN